MNLIRKLYMPCGNTVIMRLKQKNLINCFISGTLCYNIALLFKSCRYTVPFVNKIKK